MYIADLLAIEKESVNRRLSGKVQFTIREMEVLCRALNISLDDLMEDKKKKVLPFLEMQTKLYTSSTEEFIENAYLAATLFESIANKRSVAGNVFTSLPLELTYRLPYLNKYVFYSWGYFYSGSEDFNNYSTWVMPKRLREANYKLMNAAARFRHQLYIWNPITILSTLKELQFFRNIYAINEADVGHIKKELHKMLDNLENIAKVDYVNVNDKQRIDIYISSINHNVDISYYITDEGVYTFSNNYFITSNLHNNKEYRDAISEWVNSIKKVSTLISESGVKERKLFFNEQHKYVDDFS